MKEVMKILISLGIVFILSFTLLSIALDVFFHPMAATTTTTTTTTSTTTTTTTTSTTTTTTTTSTTTTTTTTSTTTSTSTTSTTSSTTSSTIQLEHCVMHSDCGAEYYAGTYICYGGDVALMKYLPRCVNGVCKEKVEIQPVDKCHRNESCIPGRRKCLMQGEMENVSAFIEIYPDRYVRGYGAYNFRLNYTVYTSPYETSAILIDVIKPDGTETQIMSRWDIEAKIDDLEVGIYSIKRSSAVVWIQKI